MESDKISSIFSDNMYFLGIFGSDAKNGVTPFLSSLPSYNFILTEYILITNKPIIMKLHKEIILPYTMYSKQK